MKLQDAVAACFGKYATFQGRACRAEFWYWTAFAAILPLLIGRVVPNAAWLIVLAVAAPSCAVSVRRLHDTGRGGQWLLLAVIPLVAFPLFFYIALALFGVPGFAALGLGSGAGVAWFATLMARRGTAGDNRFGAEPSF